VLATVALLLCALADPRPAAADDATEAKLRFDRGLQYVRKNKVRRALDEFFISNRLSPNPSTAYNIAACLESLDRLDEAFSALSDFMTHDLSSAQREMAAEALARVLPKVARLTVTSSPPGAALFLDRENLGQYGVTPRTLAAKPGPHEVILQLPGYHPARDGVELVRGAETRLELTLTAITGTVLVRSEPAGATVRIEGVAAGPEATTPGRLSVPVGKATLVFSREGHARRLVETMVVAGREATVDAELVPLPPPTGRVRVVTNVASALVSVDSREAGFSPLVAELAEGERELRVDKPGYAAWTGPVSVDAARPTAVEVSLRPLESDSATTTLQWVLLTTSGVAALAAGGLGVRALVAADDFDSDPTRQGYDEVGNLNLAADILGGVALLGGVAALTLQLVREPEAARASTAKVSQPATMEPAPAVEEAAP